MPSTAPSSLSPFHQADARRRAGVDEVAGLQLEQAGEIGDHLRHLPDQLVEVALLSQLAVDLEP